MALNVLYITSPELHEYHFHPKFITMELFIYMSLRNSWGFYNFPDK